jgi:uncharacterized protein YndB with AHSA1/START domain
MTDLIPITIQTTVNAPAKKVWEFWTTPAHIIQWNSASPDWHTPRATMDLKTGGTFTARMEAKDGSVGFDFEGVFSEVIPMQKLAYAMPDGRKVTVLFEEKDGKTTVTETFDPESENPIEMQRDGWQAILDNFRKHTESH